MSTKIPLNDTEKAIIFLNMCEPGRWCKADQIRLLAALAGWSHGRTERAFMSLEKDGAAKSGEFKTVAMEVLPDPSEN